MGCFPRINNAGILDDINIVVPVPVDEATTRVNIHEYTHAFSLYQKLGFPYDFDNDNSEILACHKEKEYLTLKRHL